MKVLGTLDVAGLEQLTSAPTPAFPGRMYVDITTPAVSVPKMYDGTSWKNMNISYQQTAYDLINIGLAISVGSSALTIALKQSDGATDPTSLLPCYASFRSTTLANGSYTQASATAAVSLVVPSTATLGMSNSVAKYLWVYLINNAGTLELAVSGVQFDDSSVQTSTAIAAASNLAYVLYSTTLRSAKAVKLIGRLLISEATAGTWASLPTEISVAPPPIPALCMACYTISNFLYADTNVLSFAGKVFNNYNAHDVANLYKFTVPAGCAGPYEASFCGTIISSAATGMNLLLNGTAIASWLNPVAGKTAMFRAGVLLAVGDTLQWTAAGALQIDATIATTPSMMIKQLSTI